MSIDATETLRRLVIDEGGAQTLYVTGSDGKNRRFEGKLLIQPTHDKAIVIEDKPGGQRIKRLIRVTDPELAQQIAPYALFQPSLTSRLSDLETLMDTARANHGVIMSLRQDR